VVFVTLTALRNRAPWAVDALTICSAGRSGSPRAVTNGCRSAPSKRAAREKVPGVSGAGPVVLSTPSCILPGGRRLNSACTRTTALISARLARRDRGTASSPHGSRVIHRLPRNLSEGRRRLRRAASGPFCLPASGRGAYRARRRTASPAVARASRALSRPSSGSGGASCPVLSLVCAGGVSRVRQSPSCFALVDGCIGASSTR